MQSSNSLFGVSFSIKQCRQFGLEWPAVLEALTVDLNVRRFRLMSYWDEHEPAQGEYDFSQLDAQIAMVAEVGGVVSLCLGARQPRWPENHWPNWAWSLPKAERDVELLRYITTVVKRYRGEATVVSYQLENEALLTDFGERPDTDRSRLLIQFAAVKKLDPKRPVIMTTSTSWGIPVRNPVPDIVGFSYYQMLYRAGRYRRSFHRPWLDRWRATAIKLLHGRPSFIHELQAEPWGPVNIWEMDLHEQQKSMSLPQLKINLAQARKTRLYPIDLWGAEWWYWLKTTQNHPEYWDYLKQEIFTV
jgi:hypothetical protein